MLLLLREWRRWLRLLLDILGLLVRLQLLLTEISSVVIFIVIGFGGLLMLQVRVLEVGNGLMVEVILAGHDLTLLLQTYRLFLLQFLYLIELLFRYPGS